MGDMSSPDDSVILAQLRSDVAAWEREATRHHPERAALYATIALAKWLHDVARRAEVAGLRDDVLGAAHNWKAARGFELEDQERKAKHWGELLAALNRLAQLAGDGV